jgi:hypothetical protein
MPSDVSNVNSMVTQALSIYKAISANPQVAQLPEINSSSNTKPEIPK